jgi:hypothetical protein
MYQKYVTRKIKKFTENLHSEPESFRGKSSQQLKGNSELKPVTRLSSLPTS